MIGRSLDTLTLYIDIDTRIEARRDTSIDFLDGLSVR